MISPSAEEPERYSLDVGKYLSKAQEAMKACEEGTTRFFYPSKIDYSTGTPAQYIFYIVKYADNNLCLERYTIAKESVCDAQKRKNDNFEAMKLQARQMNKEIENLQKKVISQEFEEKEYTREEIHNLIVKPIRERKAKIIKLRELMQRSQREMRKKSLRVKSSFCSVAFFVGGTINQCSDCGDLTLPFLQPRPAQSLDDDEVLVTTPTSTSSLVPPVAVDFDTNRGEIRTVVPSWLRNLLPSSGAPNFTNTDGFEK